MAAPMAQADRHPQASPFTITPQRRSILPRLGSVGIQGTKPRSGENSPTAGRTASASTAASISPSRRCCRSLWCRCARSRPPRPKRARSAGRCLFRVASLTRRIRPGVRLAGSSARQRAGGPCRRDRPPIPCRGSHLGNRLRRFLDVFQALGRIRPHPKVGGFRSATSGTRDCAARRIETGSGGGPQELGTRAPAVSTCSSLEANESIMTPTVRIRKPTHLKMSCQLGLGAAALKVIRNR